MMRNWLSNKCGFVLASILLASIVYVLSANAIWIGDDITYGYHFSTGEEISSIADAFTSQVEHYKVMNGRFLAHFLVQISIAMLGQPLFSLLNSIIFVLFFFLVLKVSGVSMNDNKGVVLVAILLLFSFQTKYVPSCQIGYIWMFLLVLCFLRAFFRSSKSKYDLIWLIPLSFSAGWSQEAIVIGISVSLIVYALVNIRRMSFNQWMMFFSFGLGAILLCFSPGTLSRAGEVHGSVDYLPPFLYSLLKLAAYLRVTYLFVIYLLYLLFVRKISFKELYEQTSFYIPAWISLLFFNLFIGVFGNRQLFGLELISLLLLVVYFGKYSVQHRMLQILALCFLGLGCAGYIASSLFYLSKAKRVYNEIVTEYHSSDNGVVYYDFSSQEVTFYETNPSDAFTGYVLATIGRNEMSKHNKGENLLVLPTCCSADNIDGDMWLNPRSGTYNVIKRKCSGETSGFVQKRVIRVGSLRVPFKDRYFDADSRDFENDSLMFWTIYDKMPFVKTEGFILRSK